MYPDSNARSCATRGQHGGTHIAARSSQALDDGALFATFSWGVHGSPTHATVEVCLFLVPFEGDDLRSSIPTDF